MKVRVLRSIGLSLYGWDSITLDAGGEYEIPARFRRLAETDPPYLEILPDDYKPPEPPIEVKPLSPGTLETKPLAPMKAVATQPPAEPMQQAAPQPALRTKPVAPPPEEPLNPAPPRRVRQAKKASPSAEDKPNGE